jgi:hypothetical protein
VNLRSLLVSVTIAVGAWFAPAYAQTRSDSQLAPAAARGNQAPRVAYRQSQQRTEPLSQVWLVPNIGSLDLIDMFKHPESWRVARGKIDVFGFYLQELTKTTNDPAPVGCPDCGPNLWPRLKEEGVFSKLRSWGIDVAFEAGVIPGKQVDEGLNALALGAAKNHCLAIRRIQEAGGDVRYIQIDEPLEKAGPRHAGYGAAAAAAAEAAYISAVQSAFPGVQVGETEPYPAHGVAELEAWLRAVQANSAKPAFLHLGIDFQRLDRNRNEQAALTRDLRELRRFCEERSIGFGVTIWPARWPESDQEYYEATMRRIRTIRAALGGAPEHAVFQSWVKNRLGEKTIPRNLPETGVASHTYLVNQGLAVLDESDGACSLNAALPSTLKAETTYTVAVRCVNRGPQTWTQRRGYGLGAQVLRSNGYSALGFMTLDKDEVIPPGGTKTFNFVLRVPQTAGKYQFRWQLGEELGRWFGTPTGPVSVEVVP